MRGKVVLTSPTAFQLGTQCQYFFGIQRCCTRREIMSTGTFKSNPCGTDLGNNTDHSKDAEGDRGVTRRRRDGYYSPEVSIRVEASYAHTKHSRNFGLETATATAAHALTEGAL